MRPAFCNTNCTASATLASSVTSRRISSLPGFRAVPKTRSPRSASNRTISRPIPEEAPVTKATLLLFMLVVPFSFNDLTVIHVGDDISIMKHPRVVRDNNGRAVGMDSVGGDQLH